MLKVKDFGYWVTAVPSKIPKTKQIRDNEVSGQELSFWAQDLESKAGSVSLTNDLGEQLLYLTPACQ